ncbi:MAG TPA: GWxTD domain-containing protein, partial [Gemmatimonadales bacterium]|nr:GWxTD domain-containing protein [Gemmatimonadales bacterium]
MRVAPALTVVALTLVCQGTAWAEKRVQALTPPALCDAERARLRETALVIGPTGEPPLVPYRDRSDADRDLRRLSRIAEGPGGCAAALTNRGIIQWSLSRTGWTPKDAPGQAAGRPWRTEAVLSFSEAARVSDEGAVVGAILGATAVLQLEGVMPELATRLGPVLFARLRYPGFIADTTRHLVRGRLAVWLGLPLAADSAFVAYAGAGGDPGLAALELARIRLATGRGDSAYWMAVASRNPEVIDGLAYDLDFIADSAERAELDALGRTQRLAWFENFWRSRDLESLHPAGSRLAEHYARLAHARRHFRLMRYPRAYETFELWRNPDAEFDDRGLIYVRHGPPDDSASMAFAACPNLSWLYREPAGNMVFHFIARDDPDDWRLIETLANAEGGNGATTRLRRNFDFVGCQPEPGLLWSRAAIDPVYARLAVYPNRRDWERELGMITRSREFGTTTDSHEYRFADPMTASLQ